jgi:hypothetical protein
MTAVMPADVAIARDLVRPALAHAVEGVDDIVAALSGLGPIEVTERAVTAEGIKFSLPKEVR